jgi:hypothetical protein
MFAEFCNVNDTIIEVKVKEGNKSIYREKCNINDTKRLLNIVNFIKVKYGIDIGKDNKHSDDDWFY